MSREKLADAGSRRPCHRCHPCIAINPRLCCMVPAIPGGHMHRLLAAISLVFSSAVCFAQPGAPPIKDFIRVPSGVIALEHVRLIDGTGAAAKTDQTILISGDKITAIGAAASVQIPANANRLDFSGYSAIPGLVGMHDHLFYPA